MICPQCGYERRKSDDIISASECPKCGIIYSKCKENPSGTGIHPASAPSDKPDIIEEPKKKISIDRLVIYAGIVVVLIILTHSFVAPSVIDFLKSMEKEAGVTIDAANSRINGNPESDNARRAAHESVMPTDPALPGRELSVTDVVRGNRESIVLIKTASGIGTGFFINRDGYIVTNKHVLPDSGQGEIKTFKGSVFQIRQIVQQDLDADLVIAETSAPPSESKPVNIRSGLPEPGEKIIVIGNPMGLEQTVSDGIVSAVRRNQKAVEFIQITAPVSPGNSGGPLLNMRGEVIGVATFQYRSGQNLNFCVAASRIAALQQGVQSSFAGSPGGDAQPQAHDIYCYADGNGQVSFVTWRTGMLVSRPDGSLDRVKFERWVIDQIGGNPDAINPEREARDDLERNREQLFKSIFPSRSLSDTNLTSGEKDWLERRYQRHYVEIYNQRMAVRNEAIRKYSSMMREFDRFNAGRK